MKPEIKYCLNTSDDDIIKELYSPLLKWAKKYDRGVGYFTTGWLKANLSSMIKFVQHGGKARWITSPILNKDDYNFFINLESCKQYEYLNSIITDDVDKILDELNSRETDFLAWMIYDEILEIKFAVPSNKLHGDFHDKFGIAYNDEDIISFNGSQNDSKKGFNNYESFKVFSSWNGHMTFIENDIKRFEKLWNNNDPNVIVYKINKAIESKIFKKRSLTRPYDYTPKNILDINNGDKWIHQDEAVRIFNTKMNGILEMATGTGKTRTAIKIMQRLIQEERVNSIIICTYGTDLLEQWTNELLSINDNGILDSFIINQHYSNNKDLIRFCRLPHKKILVLSRTSKNLNLLSKKLDETKKNTTLIVFDEIHGLGSESFSNNLKGKLKSFKFKLGLSATPERSYDDLGNTFIRNEIGEVIYEFTLEDAIRKGILCEFDYIPLNYSLTDEENIKIHKIISYYKTLDSNGTFYIEEEKYRKLSDVRKLSVNKLESFDEFIQFNLGFLERCIIFVKNKAYGEKLQEKLIKYISDFHVYYSESEKSHLKNFINGDTSVLITCQKLNEGIDIKKTKNIIIFSSDKSKLKTIQRIGRCLRTTSNPDKIATVIDFVDHEFKTDSERSEWINEISKTRRSKQL